MIKSQRIYGHSERALMKATQRFHGLSSAVNQESEKLKMGRPGLHV